MKIWLLFEVSVRKHYMLNTIPVTSYYLKVSLVKISFNNSPATVTVVFSYLCSFHSDAKKKKTVAHTNVVLLAKFVSLNLGQMHLVAEN